MRNFFSICCFFLFCTFFGVFPVYAEGEFQADYSVNYTVNTDGITMVTQTVTLINKLSNIYPKQYSIVFDTDKIKNVIAYDQGGLVNPTVNQGDGKTQIILNFNRQVVGIGNKLPFTLRFENSEIVQKNGSIWEINIPGIAQTKDLGDYNVTLQVPPVFGPNAYMSPLPENGNTWTKKQMISGGISAAYGDEQYFRIRLKYFLENDDTLARINDIAIPPDTAFQKVSIRSIEPYPVGVSRDNDGNWIAKYNLPPKSTEIVTADIIVSISMLPRSEFGREPIASDLYTKPTKNWNTQAPEISRITQNLTSARDIYDYVVKNLSYSYDRAKSNPVRFGAVAALAHPQNAVCMEFTDVFVALARAVGINARQVVGFAYTTNTRLRPLSLVSDVLHSWPEYYDPVRQLWIPVDPTWANTTGGVNYFDKLDFNHIVFAINGIRDDAPLPAGSYRQKNTQGKIVEVDFADSVSAKHLSGKLMANIMFPGSIIAGISTPGKIIIHNTTGVGIDKVNLSVVSVPGDINITKNIDHITPFSDVTVPFQFSSHSLFTGGTGFIEATVYNERIRKNFIIRPVYVIIAIVFIFLIPLSVILWIIKNRLFLPKLPKP